MCKAKKARVLRVRDLRLVNISLLSKWMWIILFDFPSLWVDIIKARYGSQGFDYLLGGMIGGFRRMSF